MKKVFHILNRMIDMGMLLLFLSSFLIGLYVIVDSAFVYEHASDRSLLQYKPQESEEEVRINKKLDGSVAWLTIDNTGIDYPVMQGKDNMEYLDKDAYGDYSMSGSIFLDARNNSDCSDCYNLIYGHHMDGQKMFGQLDAFLNPDFFALHQSGKLLTDHDLYELSIMACLQTTAYNTVFFDVSGADLNQIKEEIRKEAVQFRELGDFNRLVAFSTCRDADTPIRTVVIAVMKRSALERN